MGETSDVINKLNSLNYLTFKINEEEEVFKFKSDVWNKTYFIEEHLPLIYFTEFSAVSMFEELKSLLNISSKMLSQSFILSRTSFNKILEDIKILKEFFSVFSSFKERDFEKGLTEFKNMFEELLETRWSTVIQGVEFFIFSGRIVTDDAIGIVDRNYIRKDVFEVSKRVNVDYSYTEIECITKLHYAGGISKKDYCAIIKNQIYFEEFLKCVKDHKNKLKEKENGKENN